MSLKKKDGSPSDLSSVLDKIVNRSLKNKDTTMAVTGPLGVGKSTFGIQMCMELCKRYVAKECLPLESKWDMLEDGIWSPTRKEMHDKIYAKEYMPLLFDEMFTMSSKHNWGSTLGLYAESLFLVNRTQKRPYLLIGPRLGGFAESFRNSRIHWNFLIIKTGVGVLLRRSSDPNLSDPWFLRDLEKEIKGVNENKADAEEFLFSSNNLGFYENQRNYVCTFRFSKLTSTEQAAYDLLRDKLTRNSVALETPRNAKERAAKSDERLVSIAKNRVLAGDSVKDIALAMGTTTTAVNNLLRKAGAEQTGLPVEVKE